MLLRQQGRPIFSGGATMKGLIGKATLLGVCCLLWASAALANAPSAAMSHIEGRQASGANTFTTEADALGIRLVGEAPGNPAVGAVDNPDPLGRVVVKVRDFLGNAV